MTTVQDKCAANESDATPMVRRLASWIGEFAASTMNPDAAKRAHCILLDTLGCALLASHDDKARPVFQALPRLGGNNDCTIIGSPVRSALPTAVLANGALIRLLDLNDTYTGPRQIGHPSDNIGVALAAAEIGNHSGSELLAAIRLSYEIYGRVLDLGDAENPWDHVTASGLVAAGVTGWLLRFSPDQLANALALAALHCATLGEVRVGKISGAKAIANAVVASTACTLALLAAQGITGPESALEGRRGFSSLILQGADFGGFFAARGEDRLLSTGLKQYPCFALAQGPLSAAIELRGRLPERPVIERLTIALADTGPARLRLADEHGRQPMSSEAADHSIYFLVAVALLDGRFGLDQLHGARWRDRDVIDLIARTNVVIDPALGPKAALPCRLEAELAGGARVVIDRPCTPGFASSPLSWDEVVAKFRNCARSVLDDERQDSVIAAVRGLERLSSVRTLLQSLVPKTPTAR
jgi:2-methylcitrate dehydratase